MSDDATRSHAAKWPKGWLKEMLDDARREVASWPPARKAGIVPPTEPPKRSVWDA